MQNLIWYTAKREELSSAAFGGGDLAGGGSLAPPALRVTRAPAAVAFARNDPGGLDYYPPALFMLSEESAAETLSWLRVYSREVFPLTQFARVVSDVDWEVLYSKGGEGLFTRTDKWASIVLGEILAQGEPDTELENIPLSRAAACYSTSIARATFVHDSFSVVRTCTDRLRNISEDPRFAKRVVSVDSLVPIWAVLSARLSDTADFKELVDLVLQVAESAEPNIAVAASARGLLKLHPQLFSDSVEDRVIAFQKVAGETAARAAGGSKPSPMAGALVAVAAFLVGRGTSHAFLLRKFPTIASSSFLWFGLLAAMRGPRGWDASWSRATKGIERQLRATFNWQDPPSADVSWTEYHWLTRTISGPQTFADISRLFPRTLSIEVVPGAVCQLRMSSDGRAPSEVEPKRADMVVREAAVRSTLEEFLVLSVKARHLLDSLTSKEVQPRQSALGLDERHPAAAKPKARRSYKQSSDK